MNPTTKLRSTFKRYSNTISNDQENLKNFENLKETTISDLNHITLKNHHQLAINHHFQNIQNQSSVKIQESYHDSDDISSYLPYQKTFQNKTKKYKILTNAQKQIIVKRSLQTSILQTSIQFNISINNISRWKKRIERKVGAGRRISDREMQHCLLQWIQTQNQKSITKKMVQNKAQQFSSRSNFKASKGWYQRFIKRNQFISHYIYNYNYLNRCRVKSMDELKYYYQNQRKMIDCNDKGQYLSNECKIQPIFIQSQEDQMQNQNHLNLNATNIYDVLTLEGNLNNRNERQ